MTQNNKNAFPLTKSQYNDTHGMDLRDWFAGQVLAGIISSYAHPQSGGPTFGKAESDAGMAYHYADAMMKARES